ncbi:MAG TPA: hypothetical protein VMU12_02695 [Candidatus Paceibacterota bacterium]|nr:hypothetical protein [Candidatus Paceibacterota bacterium]
MKKALWVLVIVVIVVLGWWYFSNRQSSVLTSPTPVPTNSPVSVNPTSDSALNSDAAALDAQLNTVNSDLSAVDKGLADTPVPQVQ